MIYRRVEKSDLPQILSLYKIVFNIDFTIIQYQYFYYDKYEDKFWSFIASDNDKVVGHAAIIEKECIYRDTKNIKTGLFSGGIVLPEFSGVFYQLLKIIVKSFKGDIIFGFPNKNSSDFFTKILRLSSIDANYYQLKKNDFRFKNIFQQLSFLRTNSFLEWRLDNHPKNKYYKIQLNECEVYYKQFNKTVIDIVYTTNINENFVKVVSELLNNFETINMIFKNDILTQIGFKALLNNKFVYKIINPDIEQYECQMIDSDNF